MDKPITEESNIEKPVEEVPIEEGSKGWILSGMVDNLGQLFEYNPQTSEIKYLQFELPEQPVVYD